MLFSVFLSSASSDSGLVSVDFFQEYNVDDDNIYFKYLSDRESFYSSTDPKDIQYNDQWWALTLLLEDSTQIMTSFYDPQKIYSVEWSVFKIEQHWIGQIYIDSQTDENSIFIMPVTSWVTLSFLTWEDRRVNNTIYLYPGQYILFQPRRVDSFRSADTARMQILSDIGYISYIEDNSEHINRFIDSESIYNAFYEQLDVKNRYYQEKISDIFDIKLDLSNRFSFMERNFDIFFNPEKRKSYYKNLSIKAYLDLIHSETGNQINQNIQNRSNSNIRNVINNLTQLRNLDMEWYLKVKDTIIDYNSLILRSNKSELPWLKQSLVMVENEELIEDTRELFLMFYTYVNALNDISWESSTLSARNYFNVFYDQNRDNRTALQYFTLYLEEKLKESLQNPQVYSTRNILLFMQQYIRFSKNAFSETDIEARTLLFVYQDVMTLLESYLRENFFLANRTSTDLLQRNTQSFSPQEYTELSRYIGEFIDFFDENSSLLNMSVIRERELWERVQATFILLKEYLAALENYEIYTLEYDSVSRELRELWRRDSQESFITEDEVRRYLSRFQWFWLANTQIEITDDSKAILDRISISWRNLSFTLEPLRWNWVSNIRLDNQSLNFEYPLDAIEEEWDERFRTANIDERDAFDFRRFFLITMIEERDVNIRWELEETKDWVEEDRIVTVFKRDRLLSSDGEFSIFDWVNFNFSNIIVERIDETFRIYLDDIDFSIEEQLSNRPQLYEGFFSWEYVLTNTESHFRDIHIQFYVDRERSLRTRFWDNQLQVLWDIQREDFMWVLESIIAEARNIFTVYDELTSNFWNQEIVMQYNPRNNTFTIRFDFWWERHTITYANWNIQTYLQGRNRIISSPTSVSDISQYLP